MLIQEHPSGGKTTDQQPTITLSIKESGAPPNNTYLFHISLDGHPILTNQSLSTQDSETVREISHRYSSLFEQSCRPEMDAGAEAALGARLFSLFLASSWEKIRSAVPSGSTRFLTIASDAPEILNLPWELLRSPGGDFLGLDPRFAIRRLPGSEKKLESFRGELRPRPLRLLFMACAPTDQATLDYEREEEALFRAVSGQDVAFDSCDLGTFEELKERVNEYRPHILHLTGHGVVRDGKGYFAFEKEDGTADLVPADELRRFLSGSGVQCVFASGCQTGQAPREALAGVCQALVGAEVPLAVGWAASIADDLATNFARRFCNILKDGQPVDRALCLARQEAWEACKGRDDPSWTLPVLYSVTNQNLIFDPDTQRPQELPARPAMVQEALPGMKEGYAEHFVGRRREQQRLLPALRSGDLQLLLITGLGGSGKSTLATRLARKLETYGFLPIPLSSSKENPLSSARLLQAFGDAFRKAARKQKVKGNAQSAEELAILAEDLGNARQSVESRLHDALSALNEGQFLLLLDNFESNLDEVDLHILDPEISAFYRYLLENLSGGSRAIITTRYPPSDLPELPSKARCEDLSDFSESSFLKILQRDPEVERCIRSGALSLSLLTKLHQAFGGTPRFLLQIREALKRMDAKALQEELEQVKLPDLASAGELQKIRDQYFQDIITERLYSYLSPESQKALCRAAVFAFPVTLEGFFAVSGSPQESMSALAGEWANRAFVYRNPERPTWTVYGLLRPWLLSKLSDEELKKAHKVAGDFLMEMEKKGRLNENGIFWLESLMEARSQYLQAGELDLARDVNKQLSNIFVRSGFYGGVRRLNLELLQYQEHPNPMHWIGRSYLDQGDYSSAQHWYQHCLSVSSALNSEKKVHEALALNGLASIDLRKGDYKGAREKFEMLLKITQQMGFQAGEATAWHNLASIDINIGDCQAAQDKYEKAMKIRLRIGDRDGAAFTWNQLAIIDLEKGDHQAARVKFENALNIFQQTGNLLGEASAWHNLATVDLEREGDYQAAQEKFENSMKIKQQIGDRAGEAQTWHQLATIDFKKDDCQAARDKFKKALKIVQLIGDMEGEAAVFYQLGFLSWNEDYTQEGLRLMAISHLITKSIGHEKAQLSLKSLSAMASQLKYSQESFDAMLKEVAESYSHDRGWSLIRVAFPES